MMPQAAIDNCSVCESSRLVPDPKHEGEIYQGNIPCPNCSQVTDEHRAFYLECRGSSCPFCFSTDITGSQNVEVNDGYAWQEIDCYACNRTWRDDYTLTGITLDSGSGE